jgi:UDPglucose 6-dehydrogenase
MRVTVLGLWHLGCVTAACLAEAGHRVTGLDFDERIIGDLKQGKPPLHEPGLAELIQACAARGSLTFTSDAAAALCDTDVLWVAFDTPVNDDDEADVAWVRRQIDAVAVHLPAEAVVLTSSQVPVGFTAGLEKTWRQRGPRFAVSPENLRLGKALDCFRKPERIVVGCREEATRRLLGDLLKPFSENIVWMTVESAEMTKHALNAFLATSVTFINELARICEAVGADCKQVERGLKSESRIGPKAYLSPGAAFAGGTLARDIRFLIDLSTRGDVSAPLFRGVWDSNHVHKAWVRNQVAALLDGVELPVVALLGLTYKPGTSTLRRSSSVELGRWLHHQGVCVKGHDPAIQRLPADLETVLQLGASPATVLAGADVAVVATEWPEFKELQADLFAQLMRRPRVIDQNHFLAAVLAGDPRIHYRATGVGKAA